MQIPKMKKGFTQYVPVILGFVVLAIITVLGLSVLSEMKGTFTENSTEYTATGNAITGLEKVTNFMPLIGIVVAIVIVLGIILGSLMRRGSRGI